MEFSVTASALGDCVVIEVRGRLDAESASELQRVVVESVRRPTPHVVVDLSAVTFLDSHGVDVWSAPAGWPGCSAAPCASSAATRACGPCCGRPILDASLDAHPSTDDQGPPNLGAHGHR